LDIDEFDLFSKLNILTLCLDEAFKQC